MPHEPSNGSAVPLEALMTGAASSPERKGSAIAILSKKFDTVGLPAPRGEGYQSPRALAEFSDAPGRMREPPRHTTPLS